MLDSIAGIAYTVSVIVSYKLLKTSYIQDVGNKQTRLIAMFNMMISSLPILNLIFSGMVYVVCCSTIADWFNKECDL